MLVKLDSVVFSGLEVKKVVVEVNISLRGLPSFDIVGLGGRSVEESRHRIKAAIQNSGLNFPDKKITVNLAPADIVKEGSFYDLPICIGVLSAAFKFTIPESSLFFGELSLDGQVRYTRGVFPLTIYASENGYRRIFIPGECVNETEGITDRSIEIYPVTDVRALFRHLSHTKKMELHQRPISYPNSQVGNFQEGLTNFDSIVGQEQLKRALVICAAGGHNLIMTGPPGSGKSMAAKALSELLPPLLEKESVEVTKIYSLIGRIPRGEFLITKRPFRQPHHTSSYAGIIGGGNSPKPGEITLAHRGVLFLDELNEFNRNVLEALRQPLESGYVSLSRSGGTVTYPAGFILVAASNPCPCGFLGDLYHECRCPVGKIEQYRRKLSGPIMDRIDLHVNVRPVEKEKLGAVFNKAFDKTRVNLGNSNLFRGQIVKAREIQRLRFEGEGIFTNSEMDNAQIGKYLRMSPTAVSLLNTAMQRMNFSARAYFKIVKIARTISDLEEKEEVTLDHMAEAILYRPGT
jgi:magnesium chelatase family protein